MKNSDFENGGAAAYIQDKVSSMIGFAARAYKY